MSCHLCLHKKRHYKSNDHCKLQNDVQAGGLGSTGQERVLDICPEKVHQRVPLFVGSPKEVEYLESFIKK